MLRVFLDDPLGHIFLTDAQDLDKYEIRVLDTSSKREWTVDLLNTETLLYVTDHLKRAAYPSTLVFYLVDSRFPSVGHRRIRDITLEPTH